MSALSEALDFDRVVHISAGGIISDADSAPSAPEACDPDVNATTLDGWQLITAGLTGQYGYDGPWLHDSEVIEGGVERKIFDHAAVNGGGYYVAIYAQWSCTHDTHPTYADLTDEENAAAREGSHDDCETRIEGWTVAYKGEGA